MKKENVILLFLLTLVSAVVMTVKVAWAAWLNVPVTSSLRKEVDASIAIRGNTVYVMWIEGNSRLFFSKSMDGGNTWKPNSFVKLGNASVVSFKDINYHPGLSLDSNGIIYVVWPDDNTIYFAKSTDDGATFEKPKVLATGRYYPDMAIDGNNNLYVVYSGMLISDWKYNQEHIYLRKSLDGGVNWGAEVKITHEKRMLYSPPKVAVNRSGANVYAIWVSPPSPGSYIRTYFSVSTDGGVTFSNEGNVTGFERHGEYHPQIAAYGDTNVYIIWVLDSFGDNNIYFIKSTDAGKNFVGEKRINDMTKFAEDPNAPAFSPALAIDKATGVIYVAWATTTGKRDIYLDKSSNGGNSWGTDESVCVEAAYQEDPVIAVQQDGQPCLLWEDNRKGNYDIYFGKPGPPPKPPKGQGKL